MKNTIMAAIIALAFSQSTRASEFFSKHSYYFLTTESKMIDPYKINEEQGTAVYYDYEDGKKKTVDIGKLSKETDETINGISQGSIVLIDMPEHNFCETFHVFENGVAYIGCQVTGVRANLGKDSAKTLHYYANVSYLTGEINETEGFRKKDKVRLLKDSGKLSAGTLVRIEAIFPNGEALVQKMGANLLDTSSLRLKFNIKRVPISDLGKTSEK